MVEAYPLYWPPGWERTHPYQRRSSRFRVSQGQATNELLEAIRLIGGKYPVVSTNIKLRRDGLPYASGPYSKTPEDPGVAVYFEYNKKQMCIPCDCWGTVRENIRAIGETIRVLRSIESWGAKSMMQASFKGFEAIPDDIRQHVETRNAVANYFQGCESMDDAKDRFRNLAKLYHPETGGSGNEQKFIELNTQFEEFKKNYREMEERGP